VSPARRWPPSPRQPDKSNRAKGQPPAIRLLLRSRQSVHRRLLGPELCAYLVSDHRVLLLVLEDTLKDWQGVDVVDLSEAVGHLMPKQRTLPVEACTAGQSSFSVILQIVVHTLSSPFPMMSIARWFLIDLRVNRARNRCASGVDSELSCSSKETRFASSSSAFILVVG